MQQHQTALDGTGIARISPRQEAVALILATGRSQKQAAKASGVGLRTIKTWTATQPAFLQRIRELRSEATVRALGKLAASAVSAASTLDFLCRNGTSEMVRLGAARAVLEMGSRLKESVELEDRIAALEGRQNQRRIA